MIVAVYVAAPWEDRERSTGHVLSRHLMCVRHGTSTSPNRVARTLRAPGYLILSFHHSFSGCFDLVASTSPLLPRLVAWRVRAMGMTANSLTTPLLALLLLCVLALASEQRMVLRVLAVVTALGALALAAGSGILALDAVQLGRSVPAAQKTQYCSRRPLRCSSSGLEFSLSSCSRGRGSRPLGRLRRRRLRALGRTCW